MQCLGNTISVTMTTMYLRFHLLPNDPPFIFQLYFKRTSLYLLSGVSQWWGQLVKGRVKRN